MALSMRALVWVSRPRKMGVWPISWGTLLLLQANSCPEDWLQDMERLLDELLLPLLNQPSLGRLWDSLRYVLCGQLGECGEEALPLLEGSWLGLPNPP